MGPRINAGGRLGKSSYGAELLISNDPKRTYQIALDLDKSNKERQAIELMLSEQINLEVKNYHNYPVLVLSGNNWHEGVIGIVASRIKEKYNKPTIIISLNHNIGKGSARSVTGFDIGSQIIKAVQCDILQKGGGHKMAGGFTIKKENIDVNQLFSTSSDGPYYYNGGWNQKAFVAWAIAGIFSVLTVWHPYYLV